MRTFPNSAVLEQISAQQPCFLSIAFLYVSPFWLLAGIFNSSHLWTPIANFALSYSQCNQALFFILQAILIASIVINCSIKYRTALWEHSSERHHSWLLLICVFLPALCFYLNKEIRVIIWLMVEINSPDLHMDQIHDKLWMALPYGVSFNGVIFSSAVMMFGPVFEEIIFTGFTLNIILRKYGIILAIILVPLIFTSVHIPQQGYGAHLIPIYLCGLTFVLIRLISGILLYSVIYHMIINIIVLLPRWAEAYFYFGLSI